MKLADTSKLTLNADGEVDGLDDFMKAFKESKPYLFAAAGSSSSPGGKKPDPKGNEPLDATKLPPDEYAKAKAKMLAR